MKFSFSTLFLASAALASSVPRAERDGSRLLNVFELYLKSDNPDLDGKPISTYQNRAGLWDYTATPLTVTSNSLASTPNQSLSIKGSIIPTLLGLNNSDAASKFLHPLITAPESTDADSFVADYFALTKTSEREYSVTWMTAKRWLAGPVGSDEGGDQGWEIVADDQKEGEFTVQIYMPVEIIAKLVAQS